MGSSLCFASLASCALALAAQWHPGEGVGYVISGGTESLPEPAPGQPETLCTEVDAEHLGRVRIRYRLRHARHRGKSWHFFWCAEHAEVVA